MGYGLLKPGSLLWKNAEEPVKRQELILPILLA
jgi:hypothetical protein